MHSEVTEMRGKDNPNGPEIPENVELLSFTATPSSIQPFGTGSVLRWAVRVPGPVRPQILLAGQQVSPSGSKTVHPAETRIYSLDARLGSQTRRLGQLTVTVDTSACTTQFVSEARVRTSVQTTLQDVYGEPGKQYDLSPVSVNAVLRSLPTVEIDSNGLQLGVPLRLRLENLPDLDADVTATVMFYAENGLLAYKVVRLSAAIHISAAFWVAAIALLGPGLGIGLISALQVTVGNLVEAQVQSNLDEELMGFIHKTVEPLLLGQGVHRVAMVLNGLSLTLCPR